MTPSMKKWAELGECPFCKKKVANGIGPDDLPDVTKILNQLPSSKIFKLSANMHDIRYHIINSEKEREFADNEFLENMLDDIEEKCKWWNKWWYKIQAKRNYLFVREFGSSFISEKGCEKIVPKKSKKEAIDLSCV